MTIDKDRVREEVEALRNAGFDVKMDLEHEMIVAIQAVRFPPGWEPRTSAIVFRLPNNYPLIQPFVYFPDNMTYKGKRPLIMMRKGGPDGWAKHCIYDLRDKWVPERHSIITMLRMIRKSFEHPNAQDPWKAEKEKYGYT